MEISGKVHEVGPVQQISDTFKKRDVVVEYAENPQFVEYIKFEAHQDNVNKFDNIYPGDEVTVSFNLRGRPWTNKEGVTTYFNSLVAWRVSKGASTGHAAPSSQPSQPQQAAPAAWGGQTDDDDDLPF